MRLRVERVRGTSRGPCVNGWVESRLKATGWEGDTEREPSGWVCTVARWTDGMGTQMGEIERAGLLQGLTTKIGDGKGVLATKRVRKVPPRHLLVPLVCSAGCRSPD